MRTRVLLIGAHARDRCTGPKHYRNLEQETGLRSANASFSVVQGFHVSSMLKVGEQLMQFRTVSKDQFKRKWGMVKVAKADATTHVRMHLAGMHDTAKYLQTHSASAPSRQYPDLPMRLPTTESARLAQLHWAKANSADHTRYFPITRRSRTEQPDPSESCRPIG